MECSEVYNLIPAYCRDELDSDQRRKVEEHLAFCRSCREDVGLEKRLGVALSNHADDEPPEDYWDDFNGRLRSRMRGSIGVLWSIGCLPGILAGVAAGLVAFGVVLSYPVVAMPGMPKWVGELLTMTVLALGIGLAIALVLRLASKRVSGQLGKDENSLMRAIRANPLYRRAFLFVSITLFAGLWAFLAVSFARDAADVPIVARVVLAAIAFLGGAISCAMYFWEYLRSGGVRPRPTILSRVLAVLAIAGLMSINLWELSILERLREPVNVVNQAEAMYQAGDEGSAISALRGAIAKYPDYPNVLRCYRELGSIYEKKGDRAQARAVYRDGIRTYDRIQQDPRYAMRLSTRASMAGSAAIFCERVGDLRRSKELERLSEKLMAEEGF